MSHDIQNALVENCKIRLQKPSQHILQLLTRLSIHHLERLMISVNEYAKFSKYQKSLKSSSNPIIIIVELGKPNTYFICLSSKWVTDVGATDHMTSNYNLFSTFQSHASPSNVTLINRSTSYVLGFGAVDVTPLISLSSILSLLTF